MVIQKLSKSWPLLENARLYLRSNYIQVCINDVKTEIKLSCSEILRKKFFSEKDKIMLTFYLHS